METHQNDPKRDDPGSSWSNFHTEFDGLGERLKNTYRKVASESGPSEEEIKAALGTLLGAWDQVAESVSTALQSPEVRQKLKDAAGSFAAAVTTTISELGSELTESERWRPTRPEQSPGEEE